ncbi:YihY/virulence factor BrkB family protein [Blastococcus atacamensis]|uniref:YihY/virulence factor BrkB family protein n=1 Tax=Blastococcus atacamensis TaxID=2070508 RepID=UPI001E3BBBAD|nr:YihY/virulence factor BrkB family protein [Blastococcus atacamensis]
MSSASSGDAPARPAWPARLWALVESRIDAARARFGWFDHLARAGGRYQGTQGDLMAAGVTYFAFLALFPVLLLVASIVGLVIAGDQLLQRELFTAIRETFPGGLGRRLVEQLSGAIDSAGFVGLIALAGFLYAGLRTMDKLRVGMERIWKGRVDEPEFLRDNLQDIVALVALGAVGVASLGLTGLVSQATSRVLAFLDLADQPGYGVLTWLLGITLAMAGDVVAFLWLLRVVPGVANPVLRLLPGALFGAVGFEVLKLIGGYYLSLISDSVTASAFGGAVGVLVWINLVARFSFFTAAWTATGLEGEGPTPPVDRLDDDGPVPHPAASR